MKPHKLPGQQLAKGWVGMGSVANTAIKSLLAKVTLKTSRMPKAGSHSTAVSARRFPVSLAPPSVGSRASCEALV